MRALIAVSAPSDWERWKLAKVEAQDEIDRARTSLAEIGTDRIRILGGNTPLTVDELVAQLHEGAEIVYLVAHGRCDAAKGPVLFLQNDDGTAAHVSWEDLRTRVRDLQERPHLVVLVSCESAIINDNQSGLGLLLAEAGVPAVLAMQGNVSTETVKAAMPVFFRELLKDGQIDRALACARGLVRERPDYWMPALYLRLKRGRLWATGGAEGNEGAAKQPYVAPAVAAPAPASSPGPAPGPAPIKVGILLSQTRTMRSTEQPMIDAAVFAIAEINEKGGLLGRQVEAILRDGKSDETVFAREAEALIAEHGVVTLFGCCNSSSRKAVKPVVERHNHLLVYPMQHEGLELSKNIVYLGLAPNQQYLWAVKYLYSEGKAKRVFLVGSDYVYPRAAAAMIGDTIQDLGGQVVGDEYIPLGSFDVAAVVGRIAQAKPDLIVSQVAGGTNEALYETMRKQGIRSAETPTLATNMTVREIQHLGAELFAGSYSAWSYFTEIPASESAENGPFLKRFPTAATETVTDPMETIYSGVHLWAQAVIAAGSDDVAAIRQSMLRQSFAAPEGLIEVDEATQYAKRTSRLARIKPDGSFEVIEWSRRAPEPYSSTRTVAQWDEFLQGLYDGWGGQWENPVR